MNIFRVAILVATVGFGALAPKYTEASQSKVNGVQWMTVEAGYGVLHLVVIENPKKLPAHVDFFGGWQKKKICSAGEVIARARYSGGEECPFPAANVPAGVWKVWFVAHYKSHQQTRSMWKHTVGKLPPGTVDLDKTVSCDPTIPPCP